MYLLQFEDFFRVPGGGVARFQPMPPQEIILSNRRETGPDSGGGARSKYSGGWVSENNCRVGAGGGSERAQRKGDIPHACASERRHHAKNG